MRQAACLFAGNNFIDMTSIRTNGRLFLILLSIFMLGSGGAVLAADNPSQPMAQLAPATAATAAPVINSGDNAWLLASAALVLMMTAPGLILFYGGLVRTKNVLSTMMHSLILMAVISTIWMVFGYSMAFGSGNDWESLTMPSIRELFTWALAVTESRMAATNKTTTGRFTGTSKRLAPLHPQNEPGSCRAQKRQGWRREGQGVRIRSLNASAFN